ncbi:MAG: 3-dehydroquinate synthase [Chloroflexi bacterium]|nr:MAG: 3-dehydroquinate synthase [Chloroflexota bacterium]
MTSVVLTGFMGSGKSTVGPILAARLGRPFVDLDQLVEAEAGMPVSAIFAREGEEGFRRRESACLDRALSGEQQVLAVGGGAPMREENWSRLRQGNVVVALLASEQTLAGRMDGAGERPLLEAGVGAAIGRLLPARLPRYREADLLVATDARPPEAVAAAVADRLPLDGLSRIPVRVAGHPHEITVGARLLHLAAPALERAGVRGTVAIASDSRLASTHAPALAEALESGGFRTALHALPAGEAAKTIEALSDFYRFLASVGVDRLGAIVALGGGTVGDAAGFAASTWLRGLPLLQLPTTLLAMVDASIGGKNGINLEAGKNLIGTVHQPCAVLVDVQYLTTVPERDYRASWAEVVKSAIIADTELLADLEAGVEPALARDGAFLRRVIASTCAIKARVVEADPLERGVRAILNYGHTVGHALEAALGYGAVPHGEAVAWGMQAAADLSRRTGRCAPELAARQERLLRAFGLLSDRPACDRARLLEAMRHDKKAQEGEVRWVLLAGPGRAEYGCRVPQRDVEATLDAVFS